MNKILSIIIPMYNVENYLNECINQINIKDIDYEILMINDGSSDNSLMIANSLANNNPKIRIISQENKGLGGARNTGVEYAIGKYILFLDADDILVKQSYKFLENANEEIFEFSSKNINVNHQEISVFKVGDIKQQTGIKYILNQKSMISVCNKVYKREFLERERLRFKENLYIEDFEFNTRAFFVCKSVSSKDEFLEYFVQSPNSITRNKDTSRKKKLVKDMILIMYLIDEFRKNYELNNEQKLFFDRRLTYLSVDVVYHSMKNKITAEEFLDDIEALKQKKIFMLDKRLDHRNKEYFRLLIKKPFIFRIIFKIYKYTY